MRALCRTTDVVQGTGKKKRKQLALGNYDDLSSALSELAQGRRVNPKHESAEQHAPRFRSSRSRALLECAASLCTCDYALHEYDDALIVHCSFKWGLGLIMATERMCLRRRQEHDRLCAIWKAPEFKADPIDAMSAFLTKTVAPPDTSIKVDAPKKGKRRGPTAKQLRTLFGESAGADTSMLT